MEEKIIFLTKEQSDREFRYQTVKHLAKLMLKNKILDEKEYEKIDTKLLEKYSPIIGRLSC